MRGAVILLSVVGSMCADPIIHPAQIVPDGWKLVIGENTDIAGAMDVLVGLRRSNVDKLQQLFKDSSTPGGEGYLKHASWKEMGDMIRPSDEAISAVVGMLASKGATDIHVANHGDYIKSSVPTQALEELTSSRFGTFEQVSSGRRLTRLVGDVKLPVSIAKYVETFSGLHGFPLEAKRMIRNMTTYKDVTPNVIQTAYGIDYSKVRRSGHTNIQAIGQFQGNGVGWKGLNEFCKHFNIEANCSIAKFIGDNPSRFSEYGSQESMLDVEYIMGVAHPVTTWVYSYPDWDFCGDLLRWASDVAAESVHPYVVSLSYGSQKIGFCDNATVQRLSEDVQKFGAMGITVVIASGDDGSGGYYGTASDYNHGKLSPCFPASIPYALAVGATGFDADHPGEEMASTYFGSGGGFSYDFDMPAYQASAVNAYLAKNPKTGSLAYAQGGRASPDVSLLGEDYLTSWSDHPYSHDWASSGTSASTPTWGAIISLLNEECLSASGGSKTLGFVNPLFYQNAAAFTDITRGSNAMGFNRQSGWKSTEGWDAVTGLGTPKFAQLQTIVRTVCRSTTPESTIVV